MVKGVDPQVKIVKTSHAFFTSKRADVLRGKIANLAIPRRKFVVPVLDLAVAKEVILRTIELHHPSQKVKSHVFCTRKEDAIVQTVLTNMTSMQHLPRVDQRRRRLLRKGKPSSRKGQKCRSGCRGQERRRQRLPFRLVGQ